jgi:hypothetical protein
MPDRSSAAAKVPTGEGFFSFFVRSAQFLPTVTIAARQQFPPENRGVVRLRRGSRGEGLTARRAWRLNQRAHLVSASPLDVSKRHREHDGNGQSDAQLHLVHATDVSPPT